MGTFRTDRLLDPITSVEVVVVVLWAGLAALTVALLVLTRTRWGQSQPLRKCVVLSLLAHVLLAGYATTVQIVSSSPFEAREPVIEISIAMEDFDPQQTAEEPATEPKPWESFALPSAVRPTPAEIARAKPVQMPQPERHTTPAPEGLSGDPSLEGLTMAEPVRKEPATLPADAPQTAPAAGKPAEPIEAPAAQRRQAERVDLPGRPEVARRAYARTPSPREVRNEHPGLPSALAEQSLPAPTLNDVPTSPDPENSLTALSDAPSSPSKGRPAEWSEAEQPQSGSPSSVTSAGQIAPARSQIDHLRPPAIAVRGGGENLGGLARVQQDAAGPPLFPVVRRHRPDRAVPEIYRLRTAPDRSRAAQRHGATGETEACVSAALKWLADNQEPDGRWNAGRHDAGRELRVAGRDRLGAGIRADTGMTGLALLAFLASGYTHLEGVYRANVREGLAYLIGEQASDGGLGGQATTFASMYCHAMAAFALSEAYGMTGDPELREPVRRAVTYTLSARNPTSGGWRYYPGDPGDTSQLGWQLMALKSAELAGVPMPEHARQGMVRFLQSVSSGDHGGLAAYRPSERASRPMTAEALASWQFLGMAPDDPRGREAGDYLLGELPGEGAVNFYYWYYATLAMYQLQGVHWERWNDALRETLVRSQRKTGPQAGSWDPNGTWGGYGGRVYSTSLGALCLEVYYRFLPLYHVVSRGTQPTR